MRANAGRRMFTMQFWITEDLFLALDDESRKRKYLELVRANMGKKLFLCNRKTDEVYAGCIAPDHSTIILYKPITTSSIGERNKLHSIVPPYWTIARNGEVIAYVDVRNSRKVVFRKGTVSILDALEDYVITSGEELETTSSHKLLYAEGSQLAFEDGDVMHVIHVNRIDDEARTLAVPGIVPIGQVFEYMNKMSEEVVLMCELGGSTNTASCNMKRKLTFGDVEFSLSAQVATSRKRMLQGRKKFAWTRPVDRPNKRYDVVCKISCRKISKEELV